MKWPRASGGQGARCNGCGSGLRARARRGSSMATRVGVRSTGHRGKSVSNSDAAPGQTTPCASTVVSSTSRDGPTRRTRPTRERMSSSNTCSRATTASSTTGNASHGRTAHDRSLQRVATETTTNNFPLDAFGERRRLVVHRSTRAHRLRRVGATLVRARAQHTKIFVRAAEVIAWVECGG